MVRDLYDEITARYSAPRDKWYVEPDFDETFVYEDDEITDGEDDGIDEEDI